MVLLDVAGPSRQYLEETQVLPALECGIEEMLRACADAAGSGRRKDPINFLAQWLMRHNPRHNPAMAQHLKKLASVAADRQAQELAEEKARIAYEAEKARRLEQERAKAEAAAAAEAAATAAKLNAEREECRLRIFHVNDVYLLDNFPALKACIEDMRQGCPNVLTTLAGDFLAPSLLSSIDNGRERPWLEPSLPDSTLSGDRVPCRIQVLAKNRTTGTPLSVRQAVWWT